MYFCCCCFCFCCFVVVVVVVVVVVDYDVGDDKVYTATALDCSLFHNLCYWLPFSEAAFCSMNYSA